MTGKRSCMRGTTGTKVYMLAQIVLLFLPDIVSGGLVVSLLPMPSTGVVSVNNLGTPGVVGMTGAGYSPGISAGMNSLGQPVGAVLTPGRVPAVQQPSAVLVTDTTGVNQVAGAPNNGPVVAIDYKLLTGVGSALRTTATAAPPGVPAGPAPPAEEPPAEPPAEDPPAEDPPAEDPPAEDPPAEDPPAEDPPAEDPPAEDPPAEDPPAE